MKFKKLLPLAVLTLLAGCSAGTSDKAPALNDTLPKQTLQSVLPAVADNEHCNAQMDTDIAYGIGFGLFNDQEFDAAKNCLVMAAPKHTRAFCYLSVIAGQEESKTPEQQSTESFNYMAYSATQNDRCAEYGLYREYFYGTFAAKQDKALGLRWLERSAMHGYPDAQSTLVAHYEEQGNLAAAYAWTRIMATADDTTAVEALKAKMTAEQLADGEKRYTELNPQVTSKKAMFDEAREEDVARYSAEIYQAYPDTFKGVPAAERHAFVKQSMLTAIAQPFTKNRGDVRSYIVIARHAQMKNPAADILQNPAITDLIKDTELSVDETIQQALVVVDKTYP